MYLILFAAIIFPPEDEIIYLFRKLKSKKKKILEVFKSPLQNGYSEKLKCLLTKQCYFVRPSKIAWLGGIG